MVSTLSLILWKDSSWNLTIIYTFFVALWYIYVYNFKNLKYNIIKRLQNCIEWSWMALKVIFLAYLILYIIKF